MQSTHEKKPTMHHRHRTSHQSSSDQHQAPKRLLPLLLVAQLMVILDITAVNIAMPNLARDLHISGSMISWTITAYSLVFGSLLLLGGRAADLLGRRRTFLTGLGIFTASSLASAIAGSAAALFAARAGQGIGAAMLSPAALSIITSSFHGTARAKALAAWGAVGGAGAALGVLLGGVLTELVDWRLIFFVNLPVAAWLAYAARRVVPADTQKPRWRGLDIRGAALATGSLAAIVYAITQAEEAGWISGQTLGIGGAGIVGLVAFALCERHTAQPLLRIEAAPRPGRRRGPVPVPGQCRSHVRPVPALLALPAARARPRPAPDRPRVHPPRPRGRQRRPRRRPPAQPARPSLGERARRSRWPPAACFCSPTSPPMAATCATCCPGC